MATVYEAGAELSSGRNQPAEFGICREGVLELYLGTQNLHDAGHLLKDVDAGLALLRLLALLALPKSPRALPFRTGHAVGSFW
jgi:hypothetical protein